MSQAGKKNTEWETNMIIPNTLAVRRQMKQSNHQVHQTHGQIRLFRKIIWVI